MQNVSGKDAKFSAQLEDKSATDSPPQRHPILPTRLPPKLLPKESLLSSAPLCLFYRTTIFSPRHLPLLLKVTLGANLSSKRRVPEIFEPGATVIVCLNFKLPLCLCGECSCELPALAASKVSKDLQSETRSDIKISQKNCEDTLEVYDVGDSVCPWAFVVGWLELSEKATESFCPS